MLSALKEIADRKWTEKSREDIEKFRCTVSPADTEEEKSIRKHVNFNRLRNVAEEFALLNVCCRAFQNLGAELETGLKPSCFLVYFFQ